MMYHIFQNIIDKLEKEKETISSNGKIHKSSLAVMRVYKAQKIVQDAEKEYKDMYLSTQKGLLKRIADYFHTDYTGNDKTAPKMELSAQELRYIADLHAEKCKLEEKLRNIEKKKNNKRNIRRYCKYSICGCRYDRISKKHNSGRN